MSKLFQKRAFMNYIRVLTVWIQFRSHVLSVMSWVHIACLANEEKILLKCIKIKSCFMILSILVHTDQCEHKEHST